MRHLVGRHVETTDSAVGAALLDAWRADPDGTAARFAKIMPRDYKAVLTAKAAALEEGSTWTDPRPWHASWRPRMADPKGFLTTTKRELPTRRPVDVRIMDWHEVYEPQDADQLHRQAGRCMDCGIPFCHDGCPLGNLIPEWNDLTWRDDWRAAAERLHATNNFPEFTGRLCPAPCETACVLGINSEAVTIKQVEVVDHRPRLRRRLGRAAGPRAADRQDSRRHRVRPGGAGRRAATDACRPHRRRARARGRHRWAAALWHPRVQDGEAPPRPAAGADGGGGHAVQPA